MDSYSATTAGITVRVRPQYLPDQSDPEARRFVWAYHVTVENHSPDVVQLISRHWIITDALGRHEEVRGPGVVGETPVLKPGEGFRYTSSCPLPTPSGVMAGSYQMVSDKGQGLTVVIPTFPLVRPGEAVSVN